MRPARAAPLRRPGLSHSRDSSGRPIPPRLVPRVVNPVRTLLPPLLALLLLPLVPVAPASHAVALANGIFVADDGTAVGATVDWDGPCNGQGLLTVTLHHATGPKTWSFLYESSMTPDVCEAVTRCFECPPVPIPFAWTLDNWEGDSHLVGGGSAYYDVYSYWTLAWTMQGDFLGGTLEFRGTIVDHLH